MKKIIVAILIATSINASAQVHKGLSSKDLRAAQSQIFKTLGKVPPMFRTWRTQSERVVRLEKVTCSEGRVNLSFDEGIVQTPIRESLCKQWEQMVRDTLSHYISKDYNDAKIGIFYGSTPIERLIPNAYRREIKPDIRRQSSPKLTPPLVKALDEPVFGKGLSNRHIALWPSHGYYMDQEDSLWKFQRPSLFGTIEDLHTFLYADQYLIPMLQNAGAVVVTPRERDTNPLEFIIDNDRSTIANPKIAHKNWSVKSGGYLHQDTLYNQNLFLCGTYLQSPSTGGTCTYTANVSTPGLYAIYISYKPLPENDPRTLYTIHHANGTSRFEVNQRIGGGWVYLGKFPITNAIEITLTADSQVTADAIKIGGGISSTKRIHSTSNVPRWAEAARYFMQYSGVPEEIYRQDVDNKKSSDYMDDYKSRGDWVSYIKNTQNIPVDLSLALHTNAGIVDSIFGTLVINYTSKGTAEYTNGKSKYAARDLADMVQTQVVDDMRLLYDTTWTRRSIYDKQYAEASRPDVPAIILEMFSHQNFNDMRLGLQPSFRFDFSRAIYKGTLKFLSAYYKLPYTVQPLPPSNFYLDIRRNKLALRWDDTPDPLEPTAKTDYFKANNTRCEVAQLDIPIAQDGKIHSYAITAYNDGGRSFPSDTLRACFYDNSPAVLIITDVQPPIVDTLVSNDPSMRGVVIDPKKSLYNDYSIVGPQIDFDPKSQFIDNNTPGWGASDNSLIFTGLKSNLAVTLNKLYTALCQSKISFVETNKSMLERLEYVPKEVFIVSTKPQHEIEAKYKTQFSEGVKINYISALE